MNKYPHDETIQLANELYDAVCDSTPNDVRLKCANVIGCAARMYALPIDQLTLSQLAETIHDYSLMLASLFDPAFDCDPLLKHPAPHDALISFLEESGLLTD